MHGPFVDVGGLGSHSLPLGSPGSRGKVGQGSRRVLHRWTEREAGQSKQSNSKI